MKQISRRHFLTLGGTAALGLLAASPAASPGASPSPAAAAPAAQPVQKPAATGTSSRDTLVFAQTQDATSLDPPMHTLIQNNTILAHLFDSLVYLDAQGKLQPQLATTWESTSPTTWTFKLRLGVTFHNGEPFDANAV